MVFTAVRLIRTGTRETHHGQENTLHKKAGYIDADCSRPSAFLLQSRGGPYIVGSSWAASQLSNDQFHAVGERINVPFGVILVPLDCLASKFPDADSSLTKIVGKLQTDPQISLSLLLERDRIGSTSNFLPSRLTFDLIPDPLDAAPGFSLIDTAHLRRGLL
jgi:hypothetical protein